MTVPFGSSNATMWSIAGSGSFLRDVRRPCAAVCFAKRIEIVVEYSSGVREIADELLYRERQFPFESKGFCEWGAKPQIKEFRS